MKSYSFYLLAISLSLVRCNSDAPPIDKILADFGRFRLTSEPLQTPEEGEEQTLKVNVEEIGYNSPQEPVEQNFEKTADAQEQASQNNVEEASSYSEMAPNPAEMAPSHAVNARNHAGMRPNHPRMASRLAGAPRSVKNINAFDNLNDDYSYNDGDNAPLISDNGLSSSKRARAIAPADAPQCNAGAEGISNSGRIQSQSYGSLRQNALDMKLSNNEVADDGEELSQNCEANYEYESGGD